MKGLYLALYVHLATLSMFAVVMSYHKDSVDLALGLAYSEYSLIVVFGVVTLAELLLEWKIKRRMWHKYSRQDI